MNRLDKEDYTVLVDYSAGVNPVYIGKSARGTPTSVARWQIKKVTYDANDNVTSIKWADKSNAFEKVWDDRASYDFSV